MNTTSILILIALAFGLVYLVIRLIWYKRVAEMLEIIAEDKGFKGNTAIFREAVSMTGTLGAMTVLALPDKKLAGEVRALREEVAALRQQLEGRDSKLQ